MEESQSATSLEKPQENPTTQIEEKASPDNSEYNSVDSYSENEEEQPVQVTKARSRSSVGESRSETEGSVILEREEGDGQESLPAKKVDDDEDKKNPQYIPKRGTFYEHDDRTAEDLFQVNESYASLLHTVCISPDGLNRHYFSQLLPRIYGEEAEKKPEEEPKSEEDPDKNAKKNKFLSKEKEKWSHDRFNETEQAPKNKNELISIYGYDIRNEEGPPRARRRRRYGRGPNKYTRNWEDEEAYTKPAPNTRIPTKKQPRPRKNQEEFPPLGGERRPQNVSESVSSDSNRDEDYIQHDDRTDKNDRIDNRHNREMSNRRSMEKQEYSRRGSRDTPQREKPYQQRKESPPNQERTIYEENKQSFQRQQSSASNRVPKPKKEIKDSDYKGFTTKTRQVRIIRTDHQKVLPPKNVNSRSKEPSAEFIQSQNFTNSKGGVGPVTELERDMGHLNVQDGVHKGKSAIQNQPQQQQSSRQGSVPPRLQQGGGVEQKGTKRYSSMRQRSLPDSATPPVGAFDPSFYPSDYNSAAPPPPRNQPILPSPPTLPPTLVAQPVPVTGAPPPMMQPPFPPAAFPPQGPPPAFLQAPPPAFIAGPPQPQIVGVSYVQPPQPQFTTAPPAFPPYQAPQFPVVSNTQPELYQPQGGITYYSADQQIVQQRAAPQKRPKAAIPIVAPNDYKELQRGSSENIAVHPYGESSDSQEYVDVHE